MSAGTNSGGSDLPQLGGTLLAVPQEDTHISDHAHSADGIGNRPGQVEADGGVGDEGGADEGVEGTGDQRDPGELGLAVLKHPNSDGQECEQGQGLVGPGEVTPQDVEALAVELGPHDDGGYQHEHGHSQRCYF